MATNLTTIFGSEIKVADQPHEAFRQYTGFAGAHGLAAMHLGSRGYLIAVTGKLASSGESYQAARVALKAVIAGIEDYLWLAAADYSFEGTTYSNVVFEKFQLLRDADGKAFHWTSEGYVTADFVCLLRALY